MVAHRVFVLLRNLHRMRSIAVDFFLALLYRAGPGGGGGRGGSRGSGPSPFPSLL